MKEQKEERESGRGESEWARDSWCWAAFDVFAGLELNVQLTEGKALFHGGNMKVTVLSRLKKKKKDWEKIKELTFATIFPKTFMFVYNIFLSSSMTVHFAPNGLFHFLPRQAMFHFLVMSLISFVVHVQIS